MSMLAFNIKTASVPNEGLFGESSSTVTISPTSSPVMYGFQGMEYYPEMGMYCTLYRCYDPNTGRWVTQDPIGYASGDPNYYRFVFNNPLRYTDPFGLDTYQFGLSGSFTGAGFTLNFSYGVAADDKGNIAPYYSSAIGAGAGFGASAGATVQTSNGDTIADLAGPFVTSSVTVGAGESATFDQFGGFGSHNQPVYGAGGTFGFGFGGAASVTYGPTILGPSINPFASKPKPPVATTKCP